MKDPDDDLADIFKQLDKLFPSEVDYKSIPFDTNPKVKDGLCPKCGRVGVFIRMALCCPKHGPYAGC